MKPHVYLSLGASLLLACAYGEQEWPTLPDAAPKADASKQDAKPPPPPQDSGVVDEPDPVQEASTPTCSTLPLATGIAACDTCLGASCCTQDQGCGGDPSCISFINCMNACMPTDGGIPDPACQSACQSSYPTGSNELFALDSCMSAQCRSQCGP